jgi:GDPmannose 4,6-dehydratase
VARIKHGLQDQIVLGNLEARRDWGYAKDYVEAMWMMLQREAPSDYVIATGRSHSVREFACMAFNIAGLSCEGRIGSDPQLFRPTEVDSLRGDPSRAVRDLGWKPDHTPIQELVRLMLEADLRRVEDEIRLGRHDRKASTARVLVPCRE